MATATATETTRTGGDKPRLTVTFTGGSDTDRLTLADIAAAHASLSYDTASATLSQSDTTPRVYRLGGGDSAGTTDCWAHFKQGDIDLGVEDTSATGNLTSKFRFGDQCDVEIGSTASDVPALNGGLVIRTGAHSTDGWRGATLIDRGAIVKCHGWLRFGGINNTRAGVFATDINGVLRLIFDSGQPDDPVPPGPANKDSGVLINLDAGGAITLNAYARSITFRRGQAPGGALQGGDYTIPAVVTVQDTFELFAEGLQDLQDSRLIVRELSMRTTQHAGQPDLQLKYVDSNGGNPGIMALRKFRGVRTPSKFKISNDDDDLTVEVGQELEVLLRDPAGNALTGDILVESGSYTTDFDTTPATLSADADGTQTLAEDADSVTTDVLDLVIARRRQGSGNQTAVTLPHSTAPHHPFVEVWVSAWVFGRPPVVRQVLALGAVGSRRDVITLAEDLGVTAGSAAAIPDELATFDDIYDALHHAAIGNRTAQIGSITGTTLDVGAYNIHLSEAGTAALSITGPTLSVKVPTTTGLSVGTKIKRIKTTGSITSTADVAIPGGMQDASGLRVEITGLPAGHSGVAAMWPRSQGLSDRSNIVSGTVDGDTDTDVVLSVTPDIEYYVVADAISYRRSAAFALDTTALSSIEISLARIVDVAGNDLIPQTLTVAEQAQADLVAYDVTHRRITVSAREKISGGPALPAMTLGQSSDAIRGDIDRSGDIANGQAQGIAVEGTEIYVLMVGDGNPAGTRIEVIDRSVDPIHYSETFAFAEVASDKASGLARSHDEATLYVLTEGLDIYPYPLAGPSRGTRGAKTDIGASPSGVTFPSGAIGRGLCITSDREAFITVEFGAGRSIYRLRVTTDGVFSYDSDFAPIVVTGQNVHGLAHDRDGGRLVAVALDEAVKMWNLPIGDRVASAEEFTAPVPAGYDSVGGATTDRDVLYLAWRKTGGDGHVYIDAVGLRTTDGGIPFPAQDDTPAITDFSFKPVARVIETGQSSAAAQADPYVTIFQPGSMEFEAGSDRMIRADPDGPPGLVPDISAFRFSKIGAVKQEEFVDFRAGPIVVNTGAPNNASLTVPDGLAVDITPAARTALSAQVVTEMGAAGGDLASVKAQVTVINSHTQPTPS